jgi:hypothetical protein
MIGGALGFALLVLGVLLCFQAIAGAEGAIFWILPPALFPGALTLCLAYLVLRASR